MRRLLPLLLPAIVLSSSSVSAVTIEDGRTFAIQNVATGKNLRPFEAGTSDGNPVILYDHHWWKCLTWTFFKDKDGAVRLSNFYTQKWLDTRVDDGGSISLTQSSTPRAGVMWEFVPRSDGSYSIRMSGTTLYVTVSAEQNNSPILLQPLQQGSSTQKWRLVAQRPWF